MEVIRINLSLVRQHELLGFCRKIEDCIRDIETHEVNLARSKANFIKLINLFDETLSLPRKNILSTSIRKEDQKRIRLWNSLRTELRYLDKYGYPKIRNLVQKPLLIIENYGELKQGNATDRNARVDNLLQDFDRKLTPDEIKELKLQKWMEDLEEANTNYKKLVLERMEENNLFPSGVSKERRKELLVAYKSFISVLKAYRVLSPTVGEALEMIEKINEVITEERPLLKARKTRNQKKKEGTEEQEEVQSEM